MREDLGFNKHAVALEGAVVAVVLLSLCFHGRRTRRGGKAGLDLASWCWAAPDPSFQCRRCYPRIWRKAFAAAFVPIGGYPGLTRWWVLRSDGTVGGRSPPSHRIFNLKGVH